MIIFGVAEKATEVGAGDFSCPNCGPQYYRRIRLVEYFTLYFLPIIPTHNKGEFIVCVRCEQLFYENVLTYQPPTGAIKPAQAPAALKVGDRILARWQDLFFYPATVRSVEPSGRCKVQFDDGDLDWVEPEQLAIFDIEIGDRLFARWKNRDRYFAGVLAQTAESQIRILYDDGDEEWTTFAVVRVERRVELAKSPEDGEDPLPRLPRVAPDKPRQWPASFNVGDRVLAQFADHFFFYPARILRVEPDHQCQIQYDDGDSAWVNSEQIAVFDIGLGDRVFARWKNGKKYFAGALAATDGERICIHYDDGDEEWTTFAVVRVARSRAPLPESHIPSDHLPLPETQFQSGANTDQYRP